MGFRHRTNNDVLTDFRNRKINLGAPTGPPEDSTIYTPGITAYNQSPNTTSGIPGIAVARGQTRERSTPSPNGPLSPGVVDASDEPGENIPWMIDAGQKSIEAIGEMDLQSWLDRMGYELNDVTGSEEYAALTGLIEQMSEGPTEGQIQDAIDYAAALAGMTREEYEQAMGDLLTQTALGIEGQQGFTDEQRDLYERGMRLDMRNMEAVAQRQIDNIQAQTGSTARALYTADQTRMQIQDAQIRSRLGMAQEEFVRQQAQWGAANNTYQNMLQSGQISANQYLQIVERQQSQALQGYATQVSTLMQENSQYLQMYQQEFNNLVEHSEAIYKAANVEMGISSEVIAQMETLFGMELAGKMAELQEEISGIQLTESEEDQDFSQTVDIVTLVISGLSIIAGVIPWEEIW